MAEGGTRPRSFKNSFSKASGDANESFCEPCINGGKWVAVEGYCQICKEYLCDTCLGVHKNQKMTRSHTILDKTQMPGGQESHTGQDLCVEVCKTHHPEIIRFYCKAHDEPGCVDCMTLNHTSCKKVRLQDISDNFQATIEFKLIHEKLDKFHNEIKLMTDMLDNDLKNLDTTYDEIQHQITSFRKKINDYLDKIQQLITDEAEMIKKTEETELKKLITENKSMNSELENILRRMQNDSDVNVNSVFIVTKQAKQKLGTMEREFDKMKQSRLQQQQKEKFRPSTKIENLVLAKTPLGTLLGKPNINMTLSYRERIKVKTLTDSKDCHITDCALLSPDKMVVVDTCNSSLKLIDISKRRVLSSYRTSSELWGVTAISHDQAAATICNEGKIQLLNVTSTFTNLYHILTKRACFSIAYSDGKLAVSYINPGSIEILDIQGQVLHTIQPTMGWKGILQKPYYITFGHDDDTVIISDLNLDNIIALTFDGDILHTYAHNKLKDPHGIVTTPDGVLFISSRSEDQIHVLSPDFKARKSVIKNDKNLVKPGCISFCRVSHRLYVCSSYPNMSDKLCHPSIVQEEDMTNTIKVYQLNI